jgi:peptidoglycan-associated lipoprotein
LKKSLLLLSLLAVFGAGCSSTPMDSASEPEAGVAGYGADGVDQATAEALGLEELRGNTLLSQRSVFFDFNRYDIKAEYLDLIGAHAQYLNNHTAARMIIKGNADYRGSHEYNLSLGQKRSVAVKDALNALGVDDSQIETISYGEEYANQECQADACGQDRRADISYEVE